MSGSDPNKIPVRPGGARSALPWNLRFARENPWIGRALDREPTLSDGVHLASLMACCVENGLPVPKNREGFDRTFGGYDRAVVIYERFKTDVGSEGTVTAARLPQAVVCLAMSRDTGNNVVRPSDALVDLLSGTDLRGVGVADLVLPFPGVFVDLARLGLRVGGHPVEGVAVTDPNGLPGAPASGPRRSYLVATLVVDDGRTIPLTTSFLVRSDAEDLEDQIEAAFRGAVDEEAVLDLSGTERPTEGTAFERACVKATAHTMRNDLATLEASGDVVLRALALAFNVIAYLTVRPHDTTPEWVDAPEALADALASDDPQRRAAAARKAAKRGAAMVRVVGGGIAPPPPGRGSGVGNGPCTHWRRGHWRRQPHGAGMAMRRLVWIAPVVVSGHGDLAPQIATVLPSDVDVRAGP